MAFIDLEKAYDRVPRELIWSVLKKKGVIRGYIDIIKDMYEGVVTSVRTIGGETKEFPVTVGLHQGSALSPYLFALVMDELTSHLQDNVPWCMLFADDVVLIDESKVGLNAKLELWRDALESKGFKISRTKTECMEFNFKEGRTIDRALVEIDGQEVPRCDQFRYLGSIIHKEGDIDSDVVHRINAGWVKWRAASGVLCDRRVPKRLKGKFYRTAIRPAILYGAECWAPKRSHIDKLNVAEMRMLRWMSGITRRDRIRNEYIRESLGVAPLGEKLRECRLRWYGHMQRRPLDAPVRRLEGIHVNDAKRGRGRPKRTWMELIRKDLTLLSLTKEVAQNRLEWRSKIRVADPK